MSIDAEGRLLGLDLGTTRTGVAVSDSARTVATPLEVIDRFGPHGSQNVAKRVGELVEEWEISAVVVGLPKHLNGSDGAAVDFVRSEIDVLGATLDVPVVTYDERLTTVTAHRSLDVQGVPAGKRRTMVDMVAAAVILQGWMDANHD